MRYIYICFQNSWRKLLDFCFSVRLSFQAIMFVIRSSLPLKLMHAIRDNHRVFPIKNWLIWQITLQTMYRKLRCVTIYGRQSTCKWINYIKSIEFHSCIRKIMYLMFNYLYKRRIFGLWMCCIYIIMHLLQTVSAKNWTFVLIYSICCKISKYIKRIVQYRSHTEVFKRH